VVVNRFRRQKRTRNKKKINILKGIFGPFATKSLSGHCECYSLKMFVLVTLFFRFRDFFIVSNIRRAKRINLFLVTSPQS